MGTLTESSKAAGGGVVVNHHSGETEDNFIADLSVASSLGPSLLDWGRPCSGGAHQPEDLGL